MQQKLVDMQSECVPLDDCLLENHGLSWHPFMGPDFLKRGGRKVKWPKADTEFKDLYKLQQEAQAEATELWLETMDWSYPPDYDAMDIAAHWGLGDGPPA